MRSSGCRFFDFLRKSLPKGELRLEPIYLSWLLSATEILGLSVYFSLFSATKYIHKLSTGEENGFAILIQPTNNYLWSRNSPHGHPRNSTRYCYLLWVRSLPQTWIYQSDPGTMNSNSLHCLCCPIKERFPNAAYFVSKTKSKSHVSLFSWVFKSNKRWSSIKTPICVLAGLMDLNRTYSTL